MKTYFYILIFFLPMIVNAKIYDCFMFNHELDLLEIRFNELYNYVDHFVLVECTQTQRGGIKPLYFQLNQQKFEKFQDKIIHVIVTNHIATNDLWARENYQRNQISRGLGGCSANDLIIISDLDEIVRGSDLEKIKNAVAVHGYVACQLDLFVFYLNGLVGQWNGPVVTKYQNILTIGPQGARNLRNSLFTIQNAGWHFSSVGTVEDILTKLDSNLHGAEFIYSRQWVENGMRATHCIPIDSQFPQYIIDHLDMYVEKGLIKENCTTSREVVGIHIHW